jgi:recombination endonuclease VII
MTDTKRCSKCETVKPVTDFRRQRTMCRVCVNTERRDHHQRCKAAYDPEKAPKEKCCPHCGDTKPAEAFATSKGRLDGLQPHCRTCSSARWRVSQYGLDTEDLKAMHTAQGGKCRVCGVPLGLYGRGGDGLHVDHDHATQHVRALLCQPCNQALGLCGESAARLRALADYAERTGRP